ncbi:uncharacterized protein LOC142625382 [Castanea sativa]|uniref:uncharacterized protein LOC142625382 n=1 Tax=Castanea sativa TaxID=21020 RepID=UPI003F64CD98
MEMLVHRSSLDDWNKRVFGHVGKKVAELQKKVEWLGFQPSSTETNQALRSTRSELNSWLDKEDEMRRQRSRLNWFQAGDRNTSFFHAKASSRQKKNLITGMFDDEAEWQEEEMKVEEMKVEEIVVGHYQNLFQSNNPTEFTELLAAIQRKVAPAMNHQLTREYSVQEVKAALKQMYPLKAPGSDGMPPLFFKHFWPTCGNMVPKTVLDFLNQDIFPPNFNEMHIVLIPKVNEPKRVTDYRPISLCNVIYKIASKVIANGLKKILPSIISETQTAFVHGRLITDNVLVAFETMHHISNKKSGKVGEMALKLDMSKAYDRVEWGCLEKIMEKPGFDERNRRSFFNDLKEKVGKKLAGWKEKMLSKAGKEVLIKAVAQAIPTYTMSCFKILDTLCDDLASLIRNFWWGQKVDEKKIAWLSWEKMCQPKSNGGMGFKKLKQFNLALLAKQGWRLQTDHTSLVHRVLKAKYFPTCEFIEASMGSNPSYSWRNIMAAQAVVRDGIKWRVGNGRNIRIWVDRWLPSGPTHRVASPRLFLHPDTLVGELIDQENARWKSDVLAALFLPYKVDII